jgi:hypothetical protein
MLRIKPPKGGEIRLSDIRQRIIDLKVLRGFNISLITCDRFQSLDFIQILETKGFKVDIISVDKDPRIYDTLISCINEDRLDYYQYEPFISEMKGLQKIKGNKYDHPPSGSKDVSDSVAAVVYQILQKESLLFKQQQFYGVKPTLWQSPFR